MTFSETLKAGREKIKKELNLQWTAIRRSADFFAETLQARGQQNDISEELKDKNGQPRMLYLAKLFFIYEEVK